MQIWRMMNDGSEQVQLTDDQFNNWFPHPSPDGKWIVFLTYLDNVDPGSHPPDKSVMLRLMDVRTHKTRELCRLEVRARSMSQAGLPTASDLPLCRIRNQASSG